MPQFRKGQSGNPAGRPPGSRNSATSMVQNLLEARRKTLPSVPPSWPSRATWPPSAFA
ncbi:MAG: DUF5681 domain-containing protein [Xanthobacteraceae bacterium]